MTYVKRCLLAAAIGAATAGGAFAQGGGGGGGGTGSTGTTTGTTVAPNGTVSSTTTTGTGTNAGTTYGTTSSSGSTATGSTSTGTTGATGNGASGGAAADTTSFETPTINDTITKGNLNSSNVLGGYYARPDYQGRAGAITGTATTSSPGGFGTVLYSSTGTTGGRGGTTGTTSGTSFGGTTGAGGRGGAGGTSGTSFGTAATGTAGGTGGRGGATGMNSSTTGANANNMVSTGLQISYTATINVPGTAILPTQLQADLRSSLDATSALPSAKGIDVTTQPGGMVLLRGSVADAEEARLAEGLIRVTPGVKRVKNELTFPAVAVK